jgi:hypothetical protein
LAIHRLKSCSEKGFPGGSVHRFVTPRERAAAADRNRKAQAHPKAPPPPSELDAVVVVGAGVVGDDGAGLAELGGGAAGAGPVAPSTTP